MRPPINREAFMAAYEADAEPLTGSEKVIMAVLGVIAALAGGTVFAAILMALSRFAHYVAG